MWSYSLGNNLGTPSYNQSYNYGGPSYDQSSNYAATSGMGSSSGGMGMGSLWGSVIGGIGQYAQSAAQADATADQAKMSAQAKLELQKQQREYDLQDHQYKKDAVSKWSKYFS